MTRARDLRLVFSAAALVDAEQLLLCNEIMTWFKYAAVLASATGFITSPAPAVRSVASRAAVLDRAEVQRPGPSLHLVSKSPARIPEPRRAAGPDLRRGPGQPRHRRQRRRRHGLRRAAASVDRFRSARRRAARGGAGAAARTPPRRAPPRPRRRPQAPARSTPRARASGTRTAPRRTTTTPWRRTPRATRTRAPSTSTTACGTATRRRAASPARAASPRSRRREPRSPPAPPNFAPRLHKSCPSHVDHHGSASPVDRGRRGRRSMRVEGGELYNVQRGDRGAARPPPGAGPGRSPARGGTL